MDNKTTIMDCAVNLFASRGYDAVSVQQITEAAGITKPTLYYYFGSKKGVLEEICKIKADVMKRMIFDPCIYEADVSFTLFKLVKTYFNYAQFDESFCRMKLSMMYSFTESESYTVIRPLLEQEDDFLQKLFLAAAKDHGNMKGRHREYAASFMGIVNTYIRLSFTHELDITDEIGFKVVHQFMHGIFS